MDPENRNKRDLPEVVAEILIEQQAIRQTLTQMQQQMQQQAEQMQQQAEQIQRNHEQTINAFNHMTTAVLDAMNRQTDRYDRTADSHTQHETEIRDLRQRVEGLEKTVYNKAG
ncbi:transposase [Hymenobacter cavernae]|uniref:Transposase IS204/IS1001/IS1096/IS1165 DDE domain-containing protein n=1 Tax=Hymenobacter cavernae TaxID=2044852 RepID=A0ABQ1UW35_9BACT|nr:transposase [Hymenobacter cavernae]GGF27595.1 hypothetical protein GCM10011383_44100 [Hymenobacter cavernae]